AATRVGRVTPPLLSEPARRLLLGYPWPGNVRELRNVVENALLFCVGEVITPEYLPVEKLCPVGDASSVGAASRSSALPPTIPPQPGGSLRSERHAFERTRILDALQECAGNQTRA